MTWVRPHMTFECARHQISAVFNTAPASDYNYKLVTAAHIAIAMPRIVKSQLATQLALRFADKKDLHTYVEQNLVSIIIRLAAEYELISDILQHIYLPKIAACSLLFLQQLMTGSKSCIQRHNMPRIIVPNLPELAVKKVWATCMSMPDFKYYIPDNWAPDGRRNDRDFFWTVAAFLDYEFVSALIKEARKKRDAAKRSRVVVVEQPTITLRPEMAALLLRDEEFRASK